MKVLLSPVFLPNIKIKYSFSGEKITATINDVSDTFDFSTFQSDGILEAVETTLPIDPIGTVKRENGILFVELMNSIEFDAPDSEKFPEWTEV